ncbi:MAG: peptidoglycan DD-metalloendopeptidase family protein [Myxococcales bacterium]|nr:peptidoglycan DD-metalloendopeptidase family protein [Myxococcales bacterium]
MACLLCARSDAVEFARIAVAASYDPHVLLLVATAHALTPPIAGAVPLPPDAELSLPFPDGTPIVVTCAYGPDCSGFHSGTDSPTGANDHYALDLVRDEVGGGDGLPVVAAAAGEVVMAQWATGGWSSYGRVVLIEHDFGDGHHYQTLYAHLSAIDVGVGQEVSAKDTIGRMGGSGDMSEHAFASHTHFAVYRDASWAGGPYGGQSTLPEAIDGYEDLQDGAHLVAGPGPDDVASVIVDDDDRGFLLTGPASRASSGGYRDDFWYAPAAMAATTRAWWTPPITRTGLYAVSAFVPSSGHATSTRAPFTVVAAGERAVLTQDQSVVGGAFHALGGGRPFKLVAGATHHVELHDGTGESAPAEVAFDALRFTWVGEAGELEEGERCVASVECDADLVCGAEICRRPCDCATGASCDEGTGTCGTWRTDEPGPQDTGDTDLPQDTGDGADPEDTAPGDTGLPVASGPTPSGCGCDHASPRASVAAALLLALAARRRRATIGG